MSRLRQVVAVVLCLLVLQSTSQAWFSFGHMAVAYVAYQHLTPQSKVRVAQLLKKNPYYNTTWQKMIPAGASADERDLMLFMIAATWPDEIKSDQRYKNDGPAGGNVPPAGPTASQNKGYTDHNRHKYWHFVDTPFSQPPSQLEPAPAPNAATQIVMFRTALGSKKSDSLKSYDLVWLEHMVGDVHQPLHSATRVSAKSPHGDNGGNNVKLDDPSKELHAFWDGLPGDSEDVVKVIAYGKTLSPADAALAQITDESVWVKESVDLATTAVYVDPILAGNGPFSITPEYKENAQKIVNQRVELAGERLANLINANLK
jgi:S1/P1 Nuclease